MPQNAHSSDESNHDCMHLEWGRECLEWNHDHLHPWAAGNDVQEDSHNLLIPLSRDVDTRVSCEFAQDVMTVWVESFLIGRGVS
jgi:hypothetical protein